MSADLEAPDHPYFGNACTGFGGESRCLLCGKPETAHGLYTPAQPCACGSPETTSLNPAEVVTHSAKACRVSPVSDGGAS